MTHVRIDDDEGTGTARAIGHVLNRGTIDGKEYVEVQVHTFSVWVEAAHTTPMTFNRSTGKFVESKAGGE